MFRGGLFKVLERINDFEEWKPVKVGIAGIDSFDAMFFHKNSRMPVK